MGEGILLPTQEADDEPRELEGPASLHLPAGRPFLSILPFPPDAHYTLSGRVIGEGAFGRVTKAVDASTKQAFAVKTIGDARATDQSRLDAEVAIHSHLDHPNIVKLHDVFRPSGKLHLVMELCTGGDLFELIQDEGRLDEVAAAQYMRQIMGVMTYLHSSGVVHRDVKPENFMLQNARAGALIKVIDFGLSKAFSPGYGARMCTVVGTSYYASPQVLAGAYNEKCDVWSCGTIAYLLLSGAPPFQGGSDAEVMRRVKAGKLEFPSSDWATTSSAAVNFVSAALTYDADQRSSAEELLNHRWLVELAPKPSGTVPRDICFRLRSFAAAPLLQRLVFVAVARRLSDEDTAEERRAFGILDARGCGRLSPSDVRAGLEGQGLPAAPDLDEVIASLGGSLGHAEFLAVVLGSHRLGSRDVAIRAAFRTLSGGGDAITASSLAVFLEEDSAGLAATAIEEAHFSWGEVASVERLREMMDSLLTWQKPGFSASAGGA